MKNGEAIQSIENKSSGKLIKDIDFKKEIKVNRIFTDANLISQHKDRLRKGIKNISEQVLDFETVQMVIKDNLFSAAMEEIVGHFEFSIDEKYKEFIKENIKGSLTQTTGKQPEDKVLNEIAEKIIKKSVVFDYLTALWKVEVKDQEIKDMLDVYYQRTNESIREVLDDKEKFEGVRRAILEEKLINKTISAFPIRFDLQPVAPNQTNSNPEAKKN